MNQPETNVSPDPPATAATSGEVRVRCSARTDVGQVREHNEDNFLVADLTRRERGVFEPGEAAPVCANGAIFAVCDGMGGAAAGEIASQLAVDIIFERMIDGIDADEPTPRDDIARRLVRAVEAAGLRIFQEAKLDRTRRGMGTTVTATALVDDHLFLAQVGDSRGYILRDGNLVQVTRDQSLVNQLIEAGQLTEEEAETFEHNNIILQALGTADTVQVDLTYVQLRKGDLLMLCSDGLSGMIRGEEIREVLRSSNDPEEIGHVLIDRANAAGGHDNVTVIVVFFDGDGLREPSADQEPLKYRKYALPDDPGEHTERARRNVHQNTPNNSGSSNPLTMPANLFEKQGDGAPGHGEQSGPSGAANASKRSDGAESYDDRVEIPGTQVPAWLIVILVLGVMALLLGTSVLLVR